MAGGTPARTVLERSLHREVQIYLTSPYPLDMDCRSRQEVITGPWTVTGSFVMEEKTVTGKKNLYEQILKNSHFTKNTCK